MFYNDLIYHNNKLFNVFYVGDFCQGWGREFESLFPLQILKGPYR